MPDQRVVAAMTLLGQHAFDAVELAGSMSQSGVYRVRVDDRDAVLKVTGADQEQDLARRELSFYQTLAAQVPVQTPQLLQSVDTDELTALVLTAHTASPDRLRAAI